MSEKIYIKARDTFAERLRFILSETGDNPRSFAKKCGIGDSTFRNYLSGRSVPTLDNIHPIARSGGVTIHWLVTGEEPVYPELSPDPTESNQEHALEVARLQGQIEALKEALYTVASAQNKPTEGLTETVD